MKILLAVDESPTSEEAVNVVGGRSWGPGTPVRVLHVVEKFVPPAQELWHDAGGDLGRAREEIREQARELTERAAGWLQEQGLDAEAALRDGDPRSGIVEEAKDWGADLIIVGSHGYTGLKRALLGSVSQAVVDRAPCPVEVMRPKKREGATVDERKKVLILCTGNSARSQMAEGILRRDGGGRFEVFSAGVNPSRVRPEAVEAMREIGIDISSHRSKSADEFVGQEFDYIVTVCDNARETCPVWPGQPIIAHWGAPNPLALVMALTVLGARLAIKRS